MGDVDKGGEYRSTLVMAAIVERMAFSARLRALYFAHLVLTLPVLRVVVHRQPATTAFSTHATSSFSSQGTLPPTPLTVL